MNKLWDFFDDEPFLDNPSLFLLNNKRRKHGGAKRKIRGASMRRSKRTGRFVKGGSVRRKPVHRRGRKRVYTAAKRRTRRTARAVISLSNPRRRARRHVSRRRYHARRNPAFSLNQFGMSKDTLKTVAFTAGGMIGTPIIEGFVYQYVPVTFTSNVFGKYVVRIGSALLLAWGVGKFVGAEAGKKVAVGGLAYIALGAIKDFFPTLLPASTGVQGMGAYMPLRRQPLLGAYQRSALGSTVTNVPSRLQPNRY